MTAHVPQPPGPGPVRVVVTTVRPVQAFEAVLLQQDPVALTLDTGLLLADGHLA